ncbi:hypothetical protein MSAN_01101800 [Mycena sanguinolenta]|uniref:Uncharacterized protein n=1 Tax=Mycena sanguinolenta TaxID=230812 RepID=A0A8H6YNK8_9AGAR|nr:hypothetical protein MSAN_01101800 [Mycena sanguinolenta]
MHSSLSLSNFSKLPSSLKIRATAVASGALQETQALHNDLERIPRRYLPFLLPAFHSALNTAHIPAILTRFNSLGLADIRTDVLQAHLCLGGMRKLAVSKVISADALPDLWRTAWQWIQFLDEYHDSFSGDSVDADTRYNTFLSLMRYLHGNDPQKPFFDSTTGVYVVVGRAWRHFIHGRDPLRGLSDVSYFLGLWFKGSTWGSAALEELFVGSGGTRTDLASMVVSHIKRFLPNPDSVVTQETFFHFMGVLSMVAGKSVTGHYDYAFRDALLLCGIVNALTTTAAALCHSTHPSARHLLEVVLPTLVDQIASLPPMRLPEALRAGLLEILFSSHNRNAISPVFISFLEEIFAPATICHPVLVQLQISLPQVPHRDAAAIFRDPALLTRWESLIETIESRFRILDEYRTGTLTAMRACDALECATICPKKRAQGLQWMLNYILLLHNMSNQ